MPPRVNNSSSNKAPGLQGASEGRRRPDSPVIPSAPRPRHAEPFQVRLDAANRRRQQPFPCVYCGPHEPVACPAYERAKNNRDNNQENRPAARPRQRAPLVPRELTPHFMIHPVPMNREQYGPFEWELVDTSRVARQQFEWSEFFIFFPLVFPLNKSFFLFQPQRVVVPWPTLY